MSIKILITILVVWVIVAEEINYKNSAIIKHLEEKLRLEEKKNSELWAMNRLLIKLRKYDLEERSEPKGEEQ